MDINHTSISSLHHNYHTDETESVLVKIGISTRN